MSTDESNQVFAEGDLFHDYVVNRLIGRGSSGSVYLVRNTVLEMQYALKVLDASVAAKDETGVQRFLREARLATRIRHPNLVTVHDCGFDEERKVYYLVMDYVAGCSLRDILGFEQKLDVARATNIIEQVARAMQATQPFHVVHRDIKPENIMIEANGCARLLDLGIAKAVSLGDAVRTRAGCMLGTPAYISPEQAMNSADVDVRADVYSLGVVFYEMLAGTCPYVGRTQAAILGQVISEDPPPDVRGAAPAVGEGVARLIRRMMEKDRDRRISSFDEVLADLQSATALGPDGAVSMVASDTEGPAPEAQKRARQRDCAKASGLSALFHKLRFSR